MPVVSPAALGKSCWVPHPAQCHPAPSFVAGIPGLGTGQGAPSSSNMARGSPSAEPHGELWDKQVPKG